MHKQQDRVIQRTILLTTSLAWGVGLVNYTASQVHAGPPLHATIEMTCFPPGGPPPCLLPEGIDAEFVSPSPTGEADLTVFDDDTANFTIRLDGLAPDLVITAWISYFFPPGPAPDPIFDPIAEDLPPVAGVSAPLLPTDAGITEGIGFDLNTFVYAASDKATLKVKLDYNPLKAGQGPLRNTMVYTHQEMAPAGSGAEQPECCPGGFPSPQAVGSSYLREFDPDTGFPALDENGRQKLLRSPLPVAFLAIVVHVDKTTHGINPGMPILPIPGTPVEVGDHFLLGLFDLSEFHE